MKVLTKEHVIYSFNQKNPARYRVEDGETFWVETDDCYSGQIKDESVKRPDIDISIMDCSVGPIYIEGAHPGDTLCVEILAIQFAPQGVMVTSKGLGVLGERIQEPDTKIIPIRDGSSIDLGGRRLEIIEIPGHTPGSIAVLDVERRVLFSGDTVQDGSIFLFGPMRNIPAFYHSLKRLEGMTGRFDLIYPSHGSFPVKKELISRLISQTAKLERGELAASEAAFMGIPLKRYEADAAVFLCDADHGEKDEMSAQGGQKISPFTL